MSKVYLVNLADHTRTDKNTTHSYLPLYQNILERKKDSATCVLEIGIGDTDYNGGSIKLWYDYFQNATVHAIDIHKKDQIWSELFTTCKDRVVVHAETDAYNEDFVKREFIDKNIQFDFVLDDGPHTLESMKQFIRLYLPLVKEDGIMIIEDIQSWDWIETLVNEIPYEYTPYFNAYDLRNTKNRYDDIVLAIQKK